MFGGYTKIGFKKSGNTKFKDDEAFVFSLDKNKVYPVIKGKDAIRCCSCCCPQFAENTTGLETSGAKEVKQKAAFQNAINEYKGTIL